MKRAVWIVLAGALVLTGCGKTLEKDVVGKWAYEENLPVNLDEGTGQGVIKCISEFFPNKSINHECDIAISMTSAGDGKKIDFEITARGTGDWSVKEMTLFDKTIDGKIEIKKYMIDGQIVTDKDELEDLQKNFESPFMKGETTAYLTKSFDGKTWVFEQELGSKTKTTFTATKQ
jgi:hypothetical protein